MYFRKGLPKPIEIHVEARQGGKKYTTTVKNLSDLGITPDKFATILGRKFAASASTKKVQAGQVGKIGRLPMFDLVARAKPR